MLEDQLDLLITDDESPGLDQLRHDLSFVAATVAQIAASLPVQRRPLTPFVRMLHCRVVWLRRNGLCPACQEAEVCNEEGLRWGCSDPIEKPRPRAGLFVFKDHSSLPGRLLRAST